MALNVTTTDTKFWSHHCIQAIQNLKWKWPITCFRHNEYRPFDSCSLLQIFTKLILCVTNLLLSDDELDDDNFLDLTMTLFWLCGSLLSASLQAKHTYLWLEGTYTSKILHESHMCPFHKIWIHVQRLPSMSNFSCGTGMPSTSYAQ